MPPKHRIGRSVGIDLALGMLFTPFLIGVQMFALSLVVLSLPLRNQPAPQFTLRTTGLPTTGASE